MGGPGPAPPADLPSFAPLPGIAQGAAAAYASGIGAALGASQPSDATGEACAMTVSEWAAYGAQSQADGMHGKRRMLMWAGGAALVGFLIGRMR